MNFRDPHENDHCVANAGWPGIHGLPMLKVDVPQLFDRHVDLKRQIDLGVRIYLAGIPAQHSRRIAATAPGCGYW